jgi:hypothetical protein
MRYADDNTTEHLMVRVSSLARRSLTLVSVAITASCADAGSPSADSTAADSAGVPIVRSTSASWEEGEAWQPAPVATIAIGQDDGPDAYQLFRVRSAVRLDNGTIAVADGASNQIRFFDSSGQHILSVGRRGEGPGEYRVISLFSKFGSDSLLVWDARLRRLTVLDREGNVGRTAQGPTFDREFYYLRAVLGNRSIIGSIDRGITVDSARAGVQQNSSELFRLDPSGRTQTLARVFTSESFVSTTDGGTVMSLPFGRNGVFAAGYDRFYYGDASAFQFAEYNTDGQLLRLIRNEMHRPTPVTETMLGEYIDLAAGGFRNDPAQARRVRDILTAAPRASFVPSYGGALVDAVGNLWVAEYAPAGADHSRWTVFDTSAALLGTVVFPPGLTVYEIGSDYVLGRQRNEWDVERVVVYSLMKPPN